MRLTTYAVVSGLLFASATLALPHFMPAKRDEYLLTAGAFFLGDNYKFNHINASLVVYSPGNNNSTVNAQIGIGCLGFEGPSCGSCLAVGVSMNISGFTAWSQFGNSFKEYPLHISPGDTIMLHAHADSLNTAFISFQESRSNYKQSDMFSITDTLKSNTSLCEKDAEWIVNVTESTPPFANISFQDPVVHGSAGELRPWENIDIIYVHDMVRNGKSVISTTVTKDAINIGPVN